MRVLTLEQAQLAYDVCVELCGASSRPEDYWSAERYFSDPRSYPHEWRFMGTLGMGGKLRLNGNRDGLPHVTCYREDETPQRLAAMEAANERLAQLFATQPEVSPQNEEK